MVDVKTQIELDRLRDTREILDRLMPYALDDAIMWHLYIAMDTRCDELIKQLRRELGHMAVHLIRDGKPSEAVYEGTNEACRQFVEQHKEVDPADELIIQTI